MLSDDGSKSSHGITYTMVIGVHALKEKELVQNDDESVKMERD